MEPITAAVVGLVVGLVAGWVVRGMSGNNARRAIEDAKERLGETVKAEVAGAIRENSEVLVGMADENFQKTMAVAKGELDRKHQLFEGLVKPLSEGYEKLNPQIEQLSAHVQSVTAETAKLSGALSDNRQVGNWGEIQLRPRRRTGRDGEGAAESRPRDCQKSAGRPQALHRLHPPAKGDISALR